MPASNFDWTPDIIVRLRRLWDEGHATAEIGRRLGVSKNAVIGKVHRLALPPRPTPIRYRDPSRPPQLRQHQTVPQLVDILPIPTGVVPAAPQPPRVDEVLDRSKPVQQAPRPRAVGRITPCCWPIGEPGRRDFRFCEMPSAPGKPYCEDHSRSAYVRHRDTDAAPTSSQAGSARRHA